MYELIIRVDASELIGTGHIMRMLALAQAWRDHLGTTSSVLFVCAELPGGLPDRMMREGFCVKRVEVKPGAQEDAVQCVAIAREWSQHPKDAWVVVDGYHFGASYQAFLRASGFKLLVIDDYNCLPGYEADILVNQNLGSEKYSYQINEECRLLTGPSYALLRREFRGVELNRASAPSGHGFRLLVTMGGADFHHMTRAVLDALEKLPGEPLNIRAVMGAAYQNFDGLRECIARSRHHVELLIDVERMTDVLLWADLAISAAGSTCWELMSLGVPLAVVMIADNQRDVAREMIDRELAANLGWHEDWIADVGCKRIASLIGDSSMREAMSKRGQAVVNRNGATAVVAAMQER